MKIKVEKFLMKQGNRVGKAAIEFEPTDGLLAGFHLLGFTICDDEQKGMFVLFPAAISNKPRREGEGKERPFFFLRPSSPDVLEGLETQILDSYEGMLEQEFRNRPRVKLSESEKIASA